MEYFLMTHQWINASQGKYDDILNSVEELKNSKIDIKQTETDAANTEKAAETGETVSSGETKKVEKKTGRNTVISIAAVISAVIVLVIIAIFINVVSDSEENDNGEETGNRNQSASVTTADNNITEGTTDKRNEETTADETESSSQTAAAADVELGDTIVLGRYNDEDIYWKVIKISEDGTEAVIISRDVISVKAYDAAESGKYNYDGETDYWSQNSEANTNMEIQAHVRGNNEWAVSNIRTWLNATGEVVKYEDQPPVVTAMSDMDIITTTDKVFLLSMDELKWLEDAGVSTLAMPTEAAVEKDETNSYYALSQVVNVKPFVWWLREPVEGTLSQCYIVGNGYYEDNMWKNSAGVECFGIRPAMTVDLKSEVIKVAE